MKLESSNGSPVMPPLKLTVMEQKLIKAESQQEQSQMNEMIQEEEFENFNEGGGDEGSSQEEVLADLLKDVKQSKKENIGETSDELAISGKKKATRKKRSINWEEAERSLLVETIKPKLDLVENRAVDAKSIKSKRLAWIQISKQFNSLNFRQRSLEQIQVQWRSMKNTAKKEYQQKNPKLNSLLEGVNMLEFMEEMQKEPFGATRSQTRNLGIQNKKDNMDIDDEDTPLAALPTTLLSNSNSEDTLPSSTLALLSPPNSAESQQAECQQQQEETTQFKKKKSTTKQKSTLNKTQNILGNSIPTACTVKRQKNHNLSNSDINNSNMTLNSHHNLTSLTSSTITTDIKQSNGITLSSMSTPPPSPPLTADDPKYKKQLFDLIKRARLSEIDHARKEHEQKLRFEQQEQELKLRQMCELHEQRMRFALIEHEARMRVYNLPMHTDKKNGK